MSELRAMREGDRWCSKDGRLYPVRILSQRGERVRFEDLYELLMRVERLSRWDRAAPLLGFATMLLGAGVGGWAAGDKFTAPRVFGCVIAGLAFLVGGFLLREERRRSARDLFRDWENRLAMYDHHPEVKAIRERYEQKEREAFERTVRGLLVRAFRAWRKWLRERQERADRKAVAQKDTEEWGL